ncbi:hypothetical protein D3C81_1453940 [compost metagenome]
MAEHAQQARIRDQCGSGILWCPGTGRETGIQRCFHCRVDLPAQERDLRGKPQRGEFVTDQYRPVASEVVGEQGLIPATRIQASAGKHERIDILGHQRLRDRIVKATAIQRGGAFGEVLHQAQQGRAFLVGVSQVRQRDTQQLHSLVSPLQLAE